MRSAPDAKPDLPAGRIVRFARRFFYGCAGIALASALSVNLTHYPGRPREWTNADALATLVLFVSFLSAPLIPVVYIGILIAAKGVRGAVLLYVGLGFLLWYFQVAAVSFEFA